MGKYSCEKCYKTFSQKSHYDKHLTRKNPCEIQTDKIKELIDKAVEEKLIELNKKLISNNTQNNITINITEQMDISKMSKLELLEKCKELGIETQTTLDVTYRTRSYNVRYNYIFNPDGAVVTYLGLGVGIRGNSLSAKANDPSFGQLIKLPGFNVISYPTLGFETTLGFQSNITENLGWYAEIGLAKSVFQGGVFIRF